MSSSRLDRAQKFLNVAEQRYQEACKTKEATRRHRASTRSQAKTATAQSQEAEQLYYEAQSKVKEAKRALKSAQQQRDFAAVTLAKIPLSYLGAIKVRHKGASTFDIFYGGVGRADGVGHGHVVVHGRRVVYRRDPSLPLT